MRVLFNPIKSLPKIAAGTMLTLAAFSCKNLELDEKAEKQAINHLSGVEYLNAQNKEDELRLRNHSEPEYSENIAYWDSLRIDGLAKKAYRQGYEMVLDSAAKKRYHRPKFKMPVDTTFNANAADIRKHIIKDVAETTNGAKLYEYFENQPEIKNKWLSFKKCFGDICVMHYYNLLSAVGKQREAFEEGASDAREKVKTMPKPKTETRSKRRR